VNGAQALVRTAARAGIDVCFANPGTTELPLVAALDEVPGIRAVLGLFEGVCTGAADGFARMARRPALTLLHLGPGLANGIANLHNARRAGSPIVNLVGDHATWHRAADAPLTSDIESLARPVSAWLRSSRSAGELATDFAEAVAAARRGGVATLIAPADCQWEAAGGPAPVPAPAAAPAVAPERVKAAAERVQRGRSAVFLGGAALSRAGLEAAARIAEACGAELWHETFPARIERGAGLPAVQRLPYFPEPAAEALARFESIVLAGAPQPVAFFGYPDAPSRLAAAERLSVLAERGEDVAAALEALADAVGAARQPPRRPGPALPGIPSGALDPAGLGAALVRVQPEDAIVVDEGTTSSLPWWIAAEAAPPHTALALTGGAIGQGLPCATGAALACPGQRVIALQADGSALYTLQALWSQAREGLDVTTVLCANRRYRILQIEMQRAGQAEPGPKAQALTDLSHPDPDWLALARGFGVPAVRVETAEALARELAASLREPGPRLIEACL
jgi:acetolactate synthase-1/2/3 large subunit